MSGWAVTANVAEGWSAIGEPSGFLFHTPEWMTVLEAGFGCSSLFVHDGKDVGAGVSLFRAGPFRIGYLGFPVGGAVGHEALSGEILEQLRPLLAGCGMVGLRIPVSAFGPPLSLAQPFAATPQTAIVDLQAWSLETVSSNRRRDVNKALRSGLEVVDATEPDHGERLYDLYRRTMQRHRGSLRYTAEYFRALIGLAVANPNLRVLIATSGDAIAGFNVVARHGSAGYYLHGAFDWEMRSARPAALLMSTAIEWAKDQGCEVFDLLPSPPEQASLVGYKEQWGGETRDHRTYTLPVSASYTLFRMAERLYRLVR